MVVGGGNVSSSSNPAVEMTWEDETSSSVLANNAGLVKPNTLHWY